MLHEGLTRRARSRSPAAGEAGLRGRRPPPDRLRSGVRSARRRPRRGEGERGEGAAEAEGGAPVAGTGRNRPFLGTRQTGGFDAPGARGDRVHAHRFRPEVFGRRPGEPLDRELARAIRALSGESLDTGAGTGQQHGPAPADAKLRQQRAEEQEGRGQVHRQRLIPDALRDLGQRLPAQHAGAVDEAAEVAGGCLLGEGCRLEGALPVGEGPRPADGRVPVPAPSRRRRSPGARPRSGRAGRTRRPPPPVRGTAEAPRPRAAPVTTTRRPRSASPMGPSGGRIPRSSQAVAKPR